MAVEEHVKMLREGAGAWNKWRTSNEVRVPELEYADLSVNSVGPLALEGVNLAGAILRSASLEGQRLVAANFENADMRAADLRGVNLEGANLRNANLQEAQLQHGLAPFVENLSGDPIGAMQRLVEEITSEGGSFSVEQEGDGGSYALPPHFIVSGIRLGSSSLKAATLDGANLRQANLAGSVLTKTSLRNADLDGANFEKAFLAQVDLTGANLRAVNVTQLNLAACDLREIPIEVTQLSALRILDLTHNRITKLPPELGALSNLEVLDLRHNSLQELPEELKQLSKLKNLFLQGNAGLNIPPEILGAEPAFAGLSSNSNDPATILDYYLRARGGKRPLNEAKLILVGRGEVGKTSLVNRLVHGHFDKGEKKTEGIQITQWPLRLSGEDVRLHVWDFGGQEIMHATHQFFLTRRSLYLLVLNGRAGGEDADADYWLKLIDSFGAGSPVIVVLNKIKEHHFDLNRRALEQKYPVRDMIVTDCADGTGIEELRRAIERETNQLEGLRDAFPASWFSIKDQLAGAKKNFLSFEAYRDLCEQHGETDAAAQEALAGYMHNLGVVLNFKDDPRLEDTHVLNPHWVTNGIYNVLNSPRLAEQKGEIRLEQLGEILAPREYPPAMRRFVFDLMKKFDLCFSFPDDECHYLIPELLDKQEPAEAAEFNPAECLNFQYHYSVLPEGLLPRFIVRTHALSEGLPRWRTGVILQFEGCRALVKADVPEKKVFIYVVGTAQSRRRLLAIIRSDFERIHADIRNLNPQEMVPVPAHPEMVQSYRELKVMEQKGVRSFPKVVGDEIVQLNVNELLNGVDLEGTRNKEQPAGEKRQVVQLFYSYSHRDEALRDELETHLKLLQRQGLIDSWHDRKITAGDEWKQQIDGNLERADIILLLVSADFIASNYCWELEMMRALERQNRGEATVVPILVRDVEWANAPFAQLQVLPKDGLAVTLWSNKDTAWRNVAEGIRKIVEEMRKKSI